MNLSLTYLEDYFFGRFSMGNLWENFLFFSSFIRWKHAAAQGEIDFLVSDHWLDLV